VAKQWNYLASEPFQVRYMVVAGLLRRFRNILEIGSYKTPVFQFIDDAAKRVLSVDPMVLDETRSPVQGSVALDYRCLEVPPFGGEPYALVILGLDLPISGKLHRLLRDAEVVIIEFPEDRQWKRSRETFDKLMAELPLAMLLKLHLDLDGNDYARFDNENEWPPRTQRYIHVVSAKFRTVDEMQATNPFVPPLPEIDTRSSALLNTTYLADKIFPEAAFEFSHGAAKDINYLGGGLLYYTLVHMLRARTCVCLGSGGAFVPRLMRQAQRDIGMASVSRTVLVDGNKGPFGRPNWAENDSFFRRTFPDIEIVVADTTAAAADMAARGLRIDYLHIDADHSFEGSLADFNNYLPLMARGALITFHDTRPNAHASVTCWQAVAAIKAMGFELVNLDQLGSGVAIIKADRP
jgi:hypothetical protein